MAYDPVLERDLFRPKSRGVVSLDDTKEEEISDDLKARREQAQAMIDAAKEKFDPSNFQTLSEQARPGVFRPVAVNMPAQQPTADTAQRMQQMAAQGVRPVGMAKGGPVYHFADGGMKPTINSSGYTENLSSDELDQLAKEKAAEAAMGLRTLGAGTEPTDMLSDEERKNVRLQKTIKAPYDPYQLEGGIKDFVTYNRPDDPTTWTSDFKDAMVDKIYKDRLAARNTVAPDFRSYVEEPTREGIAKEIDKKAADISISRGQTRATEDAAKRKEALPDVRDYAQEREASASGIRMAEDAARREQAAPDKRDFDQERFGRDLISSDNISEDNFGRRIAMPDKRDYAQEREAKGIMDLRDSVRTGDQPGAEADAARPAASVQGVSGVPGAAVAAGATPATTSANAAPATAGAATAGAAPAGGAKPAAGGVGGFKEAGESSDLGPMSIEGIRAERKREREENFNLGLIQAGLAIMGGRSSNALANIGEGAQAGVRQFAAGESESKKNMREAMRDLREEQRAARDFAERQRQFGITSGLEDKRLTEAAESNRLTRELQAELGRGRLQLDTLTARQNWDSSQSKIELERTIANNTNHRLPIERKAEA